VEDRETKTVSKEITDLEGNYFEIPNLPGQKGRWVVEVPDLPRTDIFKTVCVKALQEAFKECHPFIRNGIGRIHFEERTQRAEGAHGTGAFVKEKGKPLKVDIEISLEALKPASQGSWHIPALGIMLHEIFETDYNLKSDDLKLQTPKFSSPDPRYFTADHEVIPDARAQKIMQETLGVSYLYNPKRLLEFDETPDLRTRDILDVQNLKKLLKR
jgi:hypothetical protein